MDKLGVGDFFPEKETFLLIDTEEGLSKLSVERVSDISESEWDVSWPHLVVTSLGGGAGFDITIFSANGLKSLELLFSFNFSGLGCILATSIWGILMNAEGLVGSLWEWTSWKAGRLKCGLCLSRDFSNWLFCPRIHFRGLMVTGCFRSISISGNLISNCRRGGVMCLRADCFNLWSDGNLELLDSPSCNRI